MRLVEQHIISPGDSRYVAIDRAAFASKNLYNLANYHVRQAFIHHGVYLNYAAVFHLVKQTEAYRALPRKVSNEVLRLLGKNWKAYFKAVEAWKADPSQFLGHPNLPKYKDKTKGRNILIYDLQALSKPGLKKGVVIPSQLGIEIKTKQTHVKQVRIVPRHGQYVVEVVYEQQEKLAQGNPELIAGIDIGVNNLATLTSNKPGFTPLLVNGRPLKSINQYYNKRKANLESKLMKMDARRRTSHQLERLTNKRTLLDLEPICHHEQYIGKRVKRGLFRSSNARRINADVNGSYNIIRKAIPDSFRQGIEGVAVRPVGLPTY